MNQADFRAWAWPSHGIDEYFDYPALAQAEARQRSDSAPPARRLQEPARRPKYFRMDRDSDGHSENDSDNGDAGENPDRSGLAAFLCEKKPMLRFDQMSEGLAWDFPLTKPEKLELLILHMAVGEKEAMTALEAAKAECAETAAETMARLQRKPKRFSGNLRML